MIRPLVLNFILALLLFTAVLVLELFIGKIIHDTAALGKRSPRVFFVFHTIIPFSMV